MPLFSFSQVIDVKNFKVLEDENKTYPSGTKFDFEFEIRGDYTYSTHGEHQINLYVYKNSVSSSNLLGLIQWNREDDYDINYPNYTKKTMWFTSYTNYSTVPPKTFFLVVNYAGLTETYSYTYEAPPGNPDIDITGVSIYGDLTSVPSFYIYDNENLTVNFKNFGDGVGSVTDIHLYLSKNSNDTFGALEIGYEYNVNKELVPNGTGSHTLDFTIPAFYEGNQTSTGTYYIQVVANLNDNSYVNMPRKIYIVNQLKSATITGIESIAPDNEINGETLIYPNPSKGFFNVKLAHGFYTFLRVSNSGGQQVYSENIKGKNETKVELKNQIPGVYFVELSNEKNKEVVKVTVE